VRFSLYVLVCLIAGKVAFAQPAEIVLIRHAEEPTSGKNVHLSSKGRQRADALSSFFVDDPRVNQFGAPYVLFAAKPKPGGSVRSQETLGPTGEVIGHSVVTLCYAENYAALANSILTNRRYRGRTIVICWSHEYLADFAAALRVNPKPSMWNSKTYDRAYVIKYSAGRAKLSTIPQKLLPGDAQR
jgi:hypothetical protein